MFDLGKAVDNVDLAPIVDFADNVVEQMADNVAVAAAVLTPEVAEVRSKL